MDGMGAVKSPDLINLNDTDTDVEIQYKSLNKVPEDGDHSGGGGDTDGERPPSGLSATGASSPAASESPKSPASRAHNHVHWRTSLCEEARQLLATEGESSERHSSEDEVDVWTVTEEQRQYYTQQFLQLQPDPAALIPGSTAKAFFEKSKLPVAALSQIWNLSDVSRDGCLCLEEFVTAMHLVVLRRNRIDIPSQLPASLVPRITATAATNGTGSAAAVQPQLPAQPTAPAAQPPPQSSQSTHAQPATQPLHVAAPHPATAGHNGTGAVASPRAKEWTKFVESPMSSVSSPGIRPANFDFHQGAVQQDPQILHPVAVKGGSSARGDGDGRAERHLADGDGNTAAADRSAGAGHAQPAAAAVSSRHRALLRHASSGASVDSGPASLPVLAQTHPGLPSRQPAPPPPPPRPGASAAAAAAPSSAGAAAPAPQHARSSSLDLSSNSSATYAPSAPPAVPPRGSPHPTSRTPSTAPASAGATFADFSQFHHQTAAPAAAAAAAQQTPPAPDQPARHRQGAFEVYRKPVSGAGVSPVSADAAAATAAPLAADTVSSAVARPSGPEPSGPPPPLPAAVETRISALTLQDLTATGPWRCEELRQLVRVHRERTSTLAAVTSELNQELAEAVEERTALELQLEHMQPASD